jgi:hypothetical protein
MSYHRQHVHEDFPQLLAWYKIRDLFFGHNYVDRDIKKALELATVCDHPGAVWLTRMFAGRDVKNSGEARQVCLGCENDARAVSFAALLGGMVDEIRRVADQGDVDAQVWMAGHTSGRERFGWSEKSARQGERDGFFRLGRCYQVGDGCEKDVQRAKDNFLKAAELENVSAMRLLGELLDEADPQRFFLFGKAAAGGFPYYFLFEMEVQIRNYKAGSGYAKVVFEIGRALRGHVEEESGRIFGSNWKFDEFIGPVNQALHFFHFQLLSYRRAVDTWTMVGLRFKIVKDIRKMIGKIIWDARNEAEYVVDNRNKQKAKRAHVRVILLIE